MYRAFPLLIVSILSAPHATSDEYRITGVGQPTETAIVSYQSELDDQNTGVNLAYIPGLASSEELIEFLDNGLIDIAVVGFEDIPTLRGSALLEPFLAKNAVQLRQSINSELGAFEKTAVERDGYRVLDFWHVSSTILSSTAQVVSVDKLDGLKIYEASRQPDETLLALGANPIQMAFAEILPALQAGEIDSSVVPLDNRVQGLGLFDLSQYYVDRLYKPRLVAVLMKDERWVGLPFTDQHYLAKIAEEIGESLVSSLENQAQRFRTTAMAKGSVFSTWNSDDINTVRRASLASADPNALFGRDLINLAYDSASATPAPPVGNGESIPASDVTLLFATDRILVDIEKPETAFSSGRRTRGHTFGEANITMIAGRQYGNDLKKVTKIERLTSMTKDAFSSILTSAPEKDVVVFIHGYNNAFTDSIRRGATIQEDIAADALVISYTWPSDGELLSYGYDTSSLSTAEQNFKLFMDTVVASVPANQINIIGHSMGSRLLTRYLSGLPERNITPEQVKFNNIVYAAPDMSTTFFKQKEENPFFPEYPLSAYAERITVYSSEFDRPLGLSQKINRDQRLGLADQNTIYVEKDIISIDASLIDPARWYQKFSFTTRHSYVFDRSAGVRDLSSLLAGVDASSRAGMTQRTRNGIVFFELAP